MQTYQNCKSPLLKLSIILISLGIGCIVFTIIMTSALQQDYADMDNIKNSPLTSLLCSNLCPSYPRQSAVDTCCDDFLINCYQKQACKDQKISAFQMSIGLTSTWFQIFLILSIVFLVSSMVVIGCIIKLRRKSMHQQLMYNLQQSFLENQQNIEYAQQQEFQNYQTFLQYMIEHGYLYEIAANQKKGDKKITDSFATDDQATCPICMMEYREQKILKLRCNHKFHSSCIRDWNEANSSCPVCRCDIYE